MPGQQVVRKVKAFFPERQQCHGGSSPLSLCFANLVLVNYIENDQIKVN
jgi:hypothetical protein